MPEKNLTVEERRARIRERMRRYRARHPEKVREQYAKAKARGYQRAWGAKNRDKRAAQVHRYRARHPEAYRATSRATYHKRRAAMTPEQLEEHRARQRLLRKLRAMRKEAAGADAMRRYALERKRIERHLGLQAADEFTFDEFLAVERAI